MLTSPNQRANDACHARRPDGTQGGWRNGTQGVRVVAAEVEIDPGLLESVTVDVSDIDVARPDPSEPIWMMKISRKVAASAGKSSSWQYLATMNRERWTDWHPDPPTDRIAREYGEGDYRFEVRLNNRGPDADVYHDMQGPKMFYVKPEDVPAEARARLAASSASSTPAAAPKSSTEEAGQLLDVVMRMQQMMHPQGNNAGQTAAISPEAAAKIAVAADKADRVERQLEVLTTELRVAKEDNAKSLAGVERWKNDVERKLDDALRIANEAKNVNPTATIQAAMDTAKVLGMTSGSTSEVWKEAITGIREIIAHGRDSSAPEAGSPPPDTPNNGDDAKKIEEKPHWHKHSDGQWAIAGDLIHWIGEHVRKSNTITVPQIVQEAMTRTSKSPKDAQWLTLASVADIKKLFVFVWGEKHALVTSHWTHLETPVTHFLELFPLGLASQIGPGRQWPDWLMKRLTLIVGTPREQRATKAEVVEWIVEKVESYAANAGSSSGAGAADGAAASTAGAVSTGGSAAT